MPKREDQENVTAGGWVQRLLIMRVPSLTASSSGDRTPLDFKEDDFEEGDFGDMEHAPREKAEGEEGEQEETDEKEEDGKEEEPQENQLLEEDEKNHPEGQQATASRLQGESPNPHPQSTLLVDWIKVRDALEPMIYLDYHNGADVPADVTDDRRLRNAEALAAAQKVAEEVNKIAKAAHAVTEEDVVRLFEEKGFTHARQERRAHGHQCQRLVRSSDHRCFQYGQSDSQPILPMERIGEMESEKYRT